MGWLAALPVIANVATALVGADKASKNVNKATDTSLQQAQMLMDFEREKFEQAKVEADRLRQIGDEAAAVALEEAARAELGAEKFEALSNEYAQKFGDLGKRADEQAALKQRYARDIYEMTRQASDARQAAGQEAKAAIKGSAAALMDQARGTESRVNSALMESRGLLDRGRASINDARTQGNAYLDSAFSNIEDRFQPFMDSERRARGQLDVEMGLAPGEVNRGYRTSPAYQAVMDASNTAQREAMSTIDTAAGNTGTLYSGSRGAALMDRARQGSWERAGVEQNYFQNYMSLLTQMANPTSTNTVSSYESGIAGTKAGLAADAAGKLAGIDAQSAGMGMDAARYISDNYMGASGTGLNAEMAAQGVGLDTMRTGMEGADLLQYVDPGTASLPFLSQEAAIRLGGFNNGQAGSPYRMSAADTRLTTAGNAGGFVVGNMPTGINSAGVITNAANNSASAKNAMLSDLIKAGTNIYSSYMQNNSTVPQPPWAGGNTNPKYPYMA